jgi:hypothetical protein
VLERKRDGPGGRDHSSLLTQVLERLDTRRPYDAAELRERDSDLRRQVAALSSGVPAANTLVTPAPTPTSAAPAVGSPSAAANASGSKSNKKASSLASLGGYLASALVNPKHSGVVGSPASSVFASPGGAVAATTPSSPASAVLSGGGFGFFVPIHAVDDVLEPVR